MVLLWRDRGLVVSLHSRPARPEPALSHLLFPYLYERRVDVLHDLALQEGVAHVDEALLLVLELLPRGLALLLSKVLVDLKENSKVSVTTLFFAQLDFAKV